MPTRRGFLGRMWLALGGVALVEYAWLAFEFLRPPRESTAALPISRTCTHLGCTVPWVEEEGRFLCPCHASAFDLRGVVSNPPAPRPLDTHPVRIENGIVRVDLGRTVRRESFDRDQVTYA